jgi:hypothetical protein
MASLDRSMRAISGALQSLAEVTVRLVNATEQNGRFLRQVRDAVLRGRNGPSGNGKHR